MRPFRLVSVVLAFVVSAGVAAVPLIDFLRGASLVVRAADLHGRVPDLVARFDTSRVTSGELSVPSRTGPLRARLYRPSRPFSRTVVLTPGVHSEGIDEPRLRKFANDLAASGVAVVTPELPDLLRYEITRRLPDQIGDVAAWVTEQRELSPDGRVALVGISFCGGMSVVAAGQPGIRDRVAFVLSFGGHGDLGRVMRFLYTGTRPDGSYFRPHDYGVVVLLLNFTAPLIPPDQIDALKAGVRTFMKASHVDMVDRQEAARIFARAIDLEEGLPSPARDLLHLVNTRDVEALGKLLAPVVPSVPLPDEVSPERAPSPRAPVYLLHGEGDVVIPAQESERLADNLRARGATVHLLVTPLISHAEVDRPPGARDAFDLIRFWMRLLRE
jgi:dienelactone hydrolase